MTNEEKKNYLNLMVAFQSTPFISELEKRNYFLSMTPKVLYKYRKFDEYTVDMIENGYVFLAPAGALDDPFDCLTNIDLDSIYDKDSFNLSNEMMVHIVDIIFSHPHSENIDKHEMVDMIKRCTINGKLSNDLIKKELNANRILNDEQKELFLNTMINFQNVIANIFEDDNLKKLLLFLMQSKDKVGVCSLTTKRNNKPMWSLYGDTYKGYCIEYETMFNNDVLPSLCPVIYTKEFDNNILKTMIKFSLETIIRSVSNGRIPTDMGCFTQLICTKDSDWEYQDEWRIVGNANAKIKPMKIKSIYLGFDVSEENEKTIKELAMNKAFNIFKMNKPTGTKEITYTRII